MKKITIILLSITLFVSCKKESNSGTENPNTANQKTTVVEGNFIYHDNVAVLQTSKQVYNIIVDAKMHELNKLVEKYKKEATDMIKVQVRGEITPKAENEKGWPFNVQIKEVLSVFKPKEIAGNTIK